MPSEFFDQYYSQGYLGNPDLFGSDAEAIAKQLDAKGMSFTKIRQYYAGVDEAYQEYARGESDLRMIHIRLKLLEARADYDQIRGNAPKLFVEFLHCNVALTGAGDGSPELLKRHFEAVIAYAKVHFRKK